MKENFKVYLIENNILPVNKEKWSNIQISHTGERQRGFENKISNCYRGIGVYIYEQNGVCYYIGEGDITDRIKRHYAKTYTEIIPKNKRRRYMFFKKNLGLFNIYWIDIKDKHERKVVEAMLTSVLNPLFEEWKE